jgi:regulator of protease activity HflC (stomatin/prohibitin superfamily)
MAVIDIGSARTGLRYRMLAPLVAFGIVAVLLIAAGLFVQVGPGERGVLMTWGAVQPGVLDPGLHYKIPLAQTVAKMDVQVQNSQAAETSASHDLQIVTTTVATNWHILPADAEWVYQNIGNESALVTKIITPAISNAVKAVTAHYDAEDLIVNRDVVRGQIDSHIRDALKGYRVVIDSVNITDFSFSPEYATAIEQKQVAQQRAQQAQYDLEKAKVVAQQRVVEAQAQAQAQKLLQETLTPEIIQQQAIVKWNGVLPQVVGANSVLPMIGNAASANAPAR